jgi:YbgC/YbaW family acyl-CoA thioester hydrolase
MPHRTEIPVTWDDTDAGGLIYYPRYFHYVIVGLNDYFAPAFDGAHPMETLRNDGLILPAVDASASFEAPLRAGETAVIETTVASVGESSLTVEFAVDRGADGERAGHGSASFVLVDEAFESTPLPESVRDCVADRGDGP